MSNDSLIQKPCICGARAPGFCTYNITPDNCHFQRNVSYSRIDLMERVRLAICKELDVNPATHSYKYLAEAAITAIQSIGVTKEPRAESVNSEQQGSVSAEVPTDRNHAPSEYKGGAPFITPQDCDPKTNPLFAMIPPTEKHPSLKIASRQAAEQLTALKSVCSSEIPYNKCPDCGADMIEVCSGLENVSRGEAASSCRHSDYCEKPPKPVMRSDEPVAYVRDIDGTGSLHICAKGDPGAIGVVYAD
jgi:hypothetical protein